MSSKKEELSKSSFDLEERKKMGFIGIALVLDGLGLMAVIDFSIELTFVYLVLTLFSLLCIKLDFGFSEIALGASAITDAVISLYISILYSNIDVFLALLGTALGIYFIGKGLKDLNIIGKS